MKSDIYVDCPIYQRELITLRQTNSQDAKELLKCYSDELAVPLFNSDNCHGDDFHYTSEEAMKKAIEFWKFSYENRYFVRWTVIHNHTQEKIGTIEMFHRNKEDEFDHYGVLRIDLQSKYETKAIIEEILAISNEFFYDAFDVLGTITKAIPSASARISALNQYGYVPVVNTQMNLSDYYCRMRN